MAELHLARLKGMGGFSKLLAIKVILSHLSSNKQFVELFLNEGRIAARISHPNVCHVFEIGEVDGQLFLAMEYLEGATWDELVRVLPADPATRVRVTTGVFAQACEGLLHAHELCDDRGNRTPVIHRDISPQNLFVTVDGVCKVLDFGVAKMGSSATHTRTGVLKGKLPYMSPEQITGQPVDARSDVFATGVVLWEAFARRPLFMRDAEFLIWKAITEEPIDPVGTWESAYGADLDAIVMRALARDPAHRQPSMRELANELRILGDSWGGALAPTELGELVRRLCRDQLAARALELVTVESATTPIEIARQVDTVADKVVQPRLRLRAASVSLGHARRRWWIPTGLAAITVAALVVAGIRMSAPSSAAAPPVSAALVVPDAAPAPVSIVPALPASQPIEPPQPEPRKPEPKQPAAKEPSTRVRRAPKPPVRARAEPEPGAPARPAEPADPGTLSVNTNPSARVYVDGVFVDETPLFRHGVNAGKHELRVVPMAGKPKVMRIEIEPGRLLNLGTVKL